MVFCLIFIWLFIFMRFNSREYQLFWILSFIIKDHFLIFSINFKNLNNLIQKQYLTILVNEQIVCILVNFYHFIDRTYLLFIDDFILHPYHHYFIIHLNRHHLSQKTYFNSYFDCYLNHLNLVTYLLNFILKYFIFSIIFSLISFFINLSIILIINLYHFYLMIKSPILNFKLINFIKFYFKISSTHFQIF